MMDINNLGGGSKDNDSEDDNYEDELQQMDKQGNE